MLFSGNDQPACLVREEEREKCGVCVCVCVCVPLTVCGSNRNFPVRVDHADGGMFGQCTTVVLDGSLEVPVPVLATLQGHTHCRLHGRTHGTRGTGVLFSCAWGRGGGGERVVMRGRRREDVTGKREKYII